MIEGVVVKKLKIIPDDRGYIMKMQEACDEEFRGFGEIYFSVIYPGIIKGWHLHEEAVLNYAVLKGMIKLVLFDDREESSTRGEIMTMYLGEKNYSLVQIPPGVWNGFQCLGKEEALVADLITLPHCKDNMRRIDPHDSIINYDWTIRDR